MARHKRFVRDDVLDRAMRAFWRHGYAGTSVQDLVEATGVNRASLYASFGDKERVFLAALDHYVARVSAGWLDALRSADSVKDGMRRYFDRLIAFSLGEGRGLGCLITNATVELAPHDAQAAASLRTHLGRAEETFFEAVRRGQASGEIAPDKDARALARFFLGTVQGLRVLMRVEADEAELRDVVNVALSVLD